MQSSSRLRSLIGYTLVVLVLGAAIFGGLQVTKNRNSAVATTQQKPVATQPQAQQPAQNSTPKTTPTTPKNNPTTAPAAPSTPKEQPKKSPVATTTPPKTSSTTTPTTPKPKTQTPVSVPATGPEDTLVATLALMGLVFTGFMYAQSRRRLTAFR